MPDPRDLTLFQWGEELRRRRLARRAGRLRTVVTAGAAVAVTALAATMMWPPRPLLVWNASASSPLGLYLVHSPRELAPGDMVVAWPPADARRLGSERHYLPANVPLVKRVAAAGGARVCAVGEAIFLNGHLATRRRTDDGAGRPLPWWTGCEDLREGDLFLLTPGAPDSFDGRYFGITRESDVVGAARLIWAR
ncbi:MAG TPA: S26 family signal peptidase [Allosphingosinicella sp.]|nr:S26 family signal peptidase [Allosphingosinicella sp.]